MAYVDVKQASGGSRWGTGLWPDPLPPLAVFDLDKDSVQPLWLTVTVPRDAPAGEYTGKLTVTAAGKPPAALDLRLTVYGFAIPPAARLRNVFQLGAGHIARMHKLAAQPGVPAGWHLGQWTGADVEGVADYFGTADFAAERAEADGGHA
ncbi:MAG: hypothetical protein HYU66_20825, partial [Armatimonadetes bacterium]|nr:hypothetical protein [Armatimonadota bacterium]